jgi:D-amino-acid oxidase
MKESDSMTCEAAIIGAGIIGITNAISLLEKGFNVTVFTKNDPLDTPSDAAVATWYAPDDTKPVLQKLCLDSLPKFDELCKTPDSGVQKIPVIHYFKNEEVFKQSIWTKKYLKTILDITDELPPEYIENKDFPKAVLIHNLLIDTPVYRKFMLERFLQLGGKLEIKEIDTLIQLCNTNAYNIVINCAGWESKYLANDKSVYPVRGQIEIAKMTENMKNMYSVNIREMDAYVIFRPQSQDCVIGTTYQLNDTGKETRLIDKDKIITKNLPFFPEPCLGETLSKAGIRCGRADTRIESESVTNLHGKKVSLIHCYGHGGSGFSASWGSAYKVFEHCIWHQGL